MSNVIINILKMSVFSSFIVLLIMFAKKVFGNKLNIKIITFMWIIVLARLIIPFTINSPISIGDILFNEVSENSNTQTTAENVSTENQQDYEIYDTAEIFTQYDYMPERSYSENMTEYISDTQVKQEDNVSWIKKTINYLSGISIWIYAFFIWVTGLSVFLTVNIFRMIIFCRKASVNKRPLRYKVRQILNENKKTLGIKRNVELIISSHIDMPITFGIINPTIIIPPTIVNTLSYDKIDLIIKHELGHIKRKDIIKTYLWMIARAIHWFNPLITIAFKIYQSDIEFACDYTVTRKLNMQKRIEYSQSLIDVIKMTQYNIKAPLTVHFCKEKLKLEERIMNMINPQKKSKSAGLTAILLTIIMITGCFTTACQPTPENLVVQNKGDDDLQEAIEQTANPEITQNETSLNNSDQVEDNITVVDAIANDLGTIKININAEVILPDDTQMPVAYVEPLNFTQNQLNDIINAFYGDAVFYDGFAQTKTEIEKRIIRMQELLSSDEKLLRSDYPSLMSVPGMPSETDINKIREYVNTRIERRWQEWESAPDEYIPLSDDVIEVQPDNEFFFIKTDIGKDYMGYVEYSNYYNSPGISTSIQCFAFENDYNLSDGLLKDISLNGRVLRAYKSIQVDINTSDSEYEYAKQLAKDLVEDIDIDGIRLDEAYISGDTVTLTSSQEGSGLTNNGVIESSDKEYYVFCFERIVGNQTIDYTFYDGRSQTEEAVYKIEPYEKIEVWIDGNEVVQFIWESPAKITNIVNENVAVDKDYTNAINNMVQHAFVKYADLRNGSASEIIIDIDKMELVMARILEKNTNKYLVVPVWKFYGNVTAMLNDSNADSKIMSSAGKSIITINALDNTIIDLQNGY